MAFAVTASTLTSCEDVPSPYDNPNNKKQEVTPSQANGSGTEADPYNVAALNAHLKSLKADSATAETFVKGKVVAIKELQTSGFGNATYYISDDGTTTGQLYIYRSLDLDNKKFTDANAIKVGDEVVVFKLAIVTTFDSVMLLFPYALAVCGVSQSLFIQLERPIQTSAIMIYFNFFILIYSSL